MNQFDDRNHRPNKSDPLNKAFKDIFAQAKHPERWETEDDSRLFIKDLMREAMEKRAITPEQLSTKANVSIAAINAFLAGKGDLSDSEPLTKIERALGVNLSSW